jgi:hypothetical protein
MSSVETPEVTPQEECETPAVTAAISKSLGLTSTEQYLSQLCDRTFLKLWSYPNPYRERGKELCDLIAVFENHVYLFFDRETKALIGDVGDFNLAWERWKKEAVAKQIRSAKKARNHVLKNRDKIFLDAACTVPVPVRIPQGAIFVHTIIVAHGASEACKLYSTDNVSGSLAVIYSDDGYDAPSPAPFVVHLERAEPVHLFDSHTVDIMLGELDTFYDFTSFIVAKEAAIAKYDYISYAGEEDVLAHYYGNFYDATQSHFIGTQDAQFNCIMIPEGDWEGFRDSDVYKRKKRADQDSYLWDELLQITSQNALDGTLLGDARIFESQSAIFEMAKEPRFARREFARAMQRAIDNFPDREGTITRNISLMPSFYDTTAYVFLQLRYRGTDDYETQYRPKRRAILEIACGVARNKFPQFSKIVGIGIDAPKFSARNSEDFVLLNCKEWPDEQRQFYEEQNKDLKFFETAELRSEIKTISNFPAPSISGPRPKLRRNERCYCGSGRKFKHCHGKVT